MEVLRQLFNDKEIDYIIEANPYIKNKSDAELGSIIKAIAETNCTNKVLRNVITTNPFVLLRDADDIKELINKLREYKFKNISNIIDLYPYILLKNAYEIDGYFIKCHNKGIETDKAVTSLEENPYLIDKE